MNAHPHSSNAERAGRWLGRAWRALVRQEIRATRWIIDNGASPLTARIVLGIVKLAVLALFAYVAFWLALLLVFALTAAKLAPHAEQDPKRPAWGGDEPTDHRQHLFYDPLTYNDDPDPRFKPD